MSRTIRSRLVLLALAWLVPVAATSLAAAWWTYRGALEAEEASNLDLARAAATSFQAYTSGLMDESSILGAAIAGEGLDLAAASRLLAVAAAKRPAVRGFLWADAAGRVLAASDRRLAGADLSGLDCVRALQAGAERALGGLGEAKAGGGPVFGVALALRDEAGALERMVVAVVDPDRLDVRGLSGLRPLRSSIVLTDATGRLVFRTPAVKPGWTQRAAPSPQGTVQGALAGRETTGVEVSVVEGDRRVAAAVPVAPHGWVARAATPLAAVARPLRRDLLFRASVVAVLALGGLGASLLIGRWIVRPLHRLGRQAAGWRECGAGERVEDGPREVRELSARFAEVADGLAEERRRLEAALGTLREADRRKDEFLAVLSHELRGPLASMRNSLAILERAPPGSEAGQRSRAVIGRQLAHVTRLVEDLLDVSRIARGKIELQRAPLELGQVLRQVAEDHRAHLEGAGVVLEVALPGEPVPLRGDEVRLAQVVGNLLQNAGRFTPAGGRVRLSLEVSAGWATVRVEDTGAGIHPDVRATLFEPFRQGPGGPARSHGGLGIGLALVKALAELHGGAVEAHSDGPGHGAEFRVHLPLAAAAAA